MISTTDPITGRDIGDVAGHPYVVEGGHYSDITIYFKSESSREECLGIPVERAGRDLTVNLDNPADDYSDAN
jgi:hypothetical protein